MSELLISERHEAGAIVLGLNGDIIFGESNTKLRRAIRRVIRDGNANIVLDLTDVMYLDSSGVGELISTLTAVNRENGRLVLLNPGERIQRILEISKLNSVFEISNEASESGESAGSEVE